MIDADQVRALRQAYWANGFRPVAVWSPGACDITGQPVRGAGKRPQGDDWRQRALRDPPDAVARSVSSLTLNTGILTGAIAGIDVDVLAPWLADAVVHRIEHMLGPTPLITGRPPKTLLVYRLEHPLAKLPTPEMFLPDGSKVQVEVLAEGQQFVCDGLHPDTGQPYRWTDGSPTDVAITELPIVTEEMVREMLDEAERLLREAGAIEKEKPTPKRALRRTAGPAGGTDFFRNVNSAALADIEGWVRRLFPTARFQPATGAWRVSSEDLGGPFEEDLSIHPDGVRDFGEEIPRSAIDLVIEYRGAKDALAAAKWLCEQLGVDPTALGWRAGNGLDEGGLAHLEARTGTGAATPSGPGPAGAAENPQPPQDNGHDPAAAAGSVDPKVGGSGGAGGGCGALPPPGDFDPDEIELPEPEEGGDDGRLTQEKIEERSAEIDAVMEKKLATRGRQRGGQMPHLQTHPRSRFWQSRSARTHHVR